MNIYQRIDAITSELAVVAKNLTVQASKTSSYKAVGERDIIDAVKPLEHKYGIVSYPVRREILDDATLESETTYNGNSTKKTTFYIKIRTTYRFVNIEKPDEYIETETISDGIDSGDKGGGKAMTYGDKYALMKVYKISTGEDPDQTASEPTQYEKKTWVREHDDVYFGDPDALVSAETVALIKKMATDARLDIKTILTKPVEQLTNKQAGSLIQSLKKRIGG